MIDKEVDQVRLKSIELEMLKHFVEICNEYNLKYYLIGGTLLGAIRHKGFIPWDDDIDVGMPRTSYNMFLEIASQRLPEYLFLQTFSSDQEYPNCFAKIRDSRTTFVETSMNRRMINHGVFIDIFPLDYYPERNRLFFKIKEFWLKIRVSCVSNSKASYKIRIAQMISKLIFPSVEDAIVKRDGLIQSNGSSSLFTNFCGAWGEKEIVPVSWFGEGTDVEFEGLRLKAPVEYDKYLKHMYGDYMTPPPVEKRKTHHFTDIIDLDNSYKQYIKK